MAACASSTSGPAAGSTTSSAGPSMTSYLDRQRPDHQWEQLVNGPPQVIGGTWPAGRSARWSSWPASLDPLRRRTASPLPCSSSHTARTVDVANGLPRRKLLEDGFDPTVNRAMGIFLGRTPAPGRRRGGPTSTSTRDVDGPRCTAPRRRSCPPPTRHDTSDAGAAGPSAERTTCRSLVPLLLPVVEEAAQMTCVNDETPAEDQPPGAGGSPMRPRREAAATRRRSPPPRSCSREHRGSRRRAAGEEVTALLLAPLEESPGLVSRTGSGGRAGGRRGRRRPRGVRPQKLARSWLRLQQPRPDPGDQQARQRRRPSGCQGRSPT